MSTHLAAPLKVLAKGHGQSRLVLELATGSERVTGYREGQDSRRDDSRHP
jgi:hypothetical protein